MWSYCIDHKGYHFRKKKSKMKGQTRHQKLFSCVLAACCLLLTSSVRVATEVMHPRLVELWRCRVQHLKKYYSTQKHKQREHPVISINTQYCPLILSLYLTIMSFTTLLTLLLNHTMKADLVESHICELSCLLYLLVIWWQFSLYECVESHPYKSKCCDYICSKCLKCLDNQSARLLILSRDYYKCSHENYSSSRLINQMLMQAGDVEANPGPDLCQKDLNAVMKSIFGARSKWYFLGLELGLDSCDLDSIKIDCKTVEECFKEMLKRWLKEIDPPPSWKRLIIALQSETVGHVDISKQLAEKHHTVQTSNGNILQSMNAKGGKKIEKGLRDVAVQKSIVKLPHTDRDAGEHQGVSEDSLPILSYKKWPAHSGSPQHQYVARLKRDTHKMRDRYSEFSNTFFKSFLSREQSKEVDFEELYVAVQDLFDIEEAELNSCNNDSRKLLLLILRVQSYLNFEVLHSLIKRCGSQEDKKNVESYRVAFKEYAERRIFECDVEVLGKEIPGHDNVMFVLGENQKAKLKDVYEFIDFLCEVLNIERHKIHLLELKTGSVIISLQFPSKLAKSFRTLPLFHSRVILLKEWSTRSFKLQNEVVHLDHWTLISSVTIGSVGIMRTEKAEVFPAEIDGDKCLAIKYYDCFSDEVTADVGYIRYLDDFFSGKKNIPTIKGVYYSPSSGHANNHYPIVVVENLKALKDLSSQTRVTSVDQISLLADITASVASFEIDQNTQVSVFQDVVFLKENFGSGSFEACFCPIYGHSYRVKKPDPQIQYPQSFPLSLQDLQWMCDVVIFIHFQGNTTSTSELPKDHILKKIFDQKWLSAEDRFRPPSFKCLSDELKNLLETEKTWLGLEDNSGDDLEDEVQIHLILIGHTGVGKTSLRKHLKNEPFDVNESPTIVMEPEFLYRESVDLLSECPFTSSGSGTNKLFLTMWDTGGQPIFQDLLPCFARLRCMYGIIFRLPDIKLLDNKPIIRPCDPSSLEVQSPFTNRDTMYRNLAYVQAFSGQMNDFSKKPPFLPAAVVVGTCKDEMSALDSESMQSLTKKKVELEEYIKKFIDTHKISVYPVPESKHYIHEIDNTVSGKTLDQGIVHLRGNISKCASDSSTKISRQWKKFKVTLQRICYYDSRYVNYGIMPLSEAIDIGINQCGIQNPKSALMYFHELGVFMWYYQSKRKIMNSFVVIDPKALLDVLSKLFYINNTKMSQDDVALLDRGILKFELFRELLSSKATKINDEWVISFMEEHHLSVKITLPTQNNIFYFIPSLLQVNPDYKCNFNNLSSSPICIVPRSGYIATGMFTRLLTALAGANYGSTVWKVPVNWSCIQNVCRNQFEFVVNDSVHVILTEYSKFIQVDCIPIESVMDIDENVYFYVLSAIDVQLQRVVPRWLMEREFKFTFKCENKSCCGLDEHFFDNADVILQSLTDSRNVTCSNGKKVLLDCHI